MKNKTNWLYPLRENFQTRHKPPLIAIDVVKISTKDLISTNILSDIGYPFYKGGV